MFSANRIRERSMYPFPSSNILKLETSMPQFHARRAENCISSLVKVRLAPPTTTTNSPQLLTAE